MWQPILRHFEFDYADGYLFWDKAGRVSRDLAQAIPNLRFQNQTIDQRDFFIPGTLELFFGVRIASLRSFERDAAEFRKNVATLVEVVTEEFELEILTSFRFRLVLGLPCSTRDEAHAKLVKLLPKEVATKLDTDLKEWELGAAQLEIRKGPIFVTSRHSIIDLPPPPGPAHPDLPGPRVPYVTASAYCEGLESAKIREFKAVAILEQMENNVTNELLKKISAELHGKPA